MATRDVVVPRSIVVDDVTYPIRLDFTAMKDFEDATGKTVLQFIRPVYEAIREGASLSDDARLVGTSVIDKLVDMDAVSAGDLQVLLWAMLGGPDSNMTQRDAGRLVHAGNISDVILGLIDAVNAALPKAREEDDAGESDEGNATLPAG